MQTKNKKMRKINQLKFYRIDADLELADRTFKVIKSRIHRFKKLNRDR